MCRNSKILVGGQALIEGVMMRYKNTVSIAILLLNNEIYLETFKIKFLEKIKWYKKIPIFRGVVEMITSFIVGYRCVLRCCEKLEFEEKKIQSKKNNSFIKLIGFFSSILSVFFVITAFMFLPAFAIKKLSELIYFNNFLKVLFEGVIKILIFIIYLVCISNLKEIKKTFQYHGAEHKTIFCLEANLSLTVENVKKQKRFHPRCGTNFMFVVLFVSIMLFSILTWDNLLIRLLFKFLMLPLVTGISYEIIKISSKKLNIITKFLVAPGLLLQRITTKEPNEKQIEVAIAALKEVLKNS